MWHSWQSRFVNGKLEYEAFFTGHINHFIPYKAQEKSGLEVDSMFRVHQIFFPPIHPRNTGKDILAH